MHFQEFQNEVTIVYYEYALSYNEGYGIRKGGQKFIIKLNQIIKDTLPVLHP